jgi:hypothetical protein
MNLLRKPFDTLIDSLKKKGSSWVVTKETLTTREDMVF